MKFLTATQAAEKIGVTKAWICQCAVNKRIEGAARHGRAWLIPVNFRISPKVSKSSLQSQ